MKWYKRFPGDYSRDTAHLSMIEHGAYALMLDVAYGTTKPLPAERRALYRILRAETQAEKVAVDKIAVEFWRPIPAEFETLHEWLGLRTDDEKRHLGMVACEWTEGSGLINLRTLREMIRAAGTGEKNRQIAIAREEKKRAQAAAGGRE
jgi:uncharacterized protein YdaU (DUF1376 family)